MAIRPIFIPSIKPPFFEKKDVSLTWHGGFSLSQKQKSIDSLHESARSTLCLKSLLEISTKSQERLGNILSAFNLPAWTDDKMYISRGNLPLETVFQTSKVFKHNISCTDLINLDPVEIRKEIRRRQKTGLSHFEFEGERWDLNPVGAFYNFLYIRSLLNLDEDLEAILDFDGFTDIEFNPNKSFNCQAEAVGQFVGLQKSTFAIDSVLNSQKQFLEIVYSSRSSSPDSQMTLGIS